MNAKRFAFVLYEEEVVEVVQEYFPKEVKMCRTNKNKTLHEIFNE